jgi:2-iminobutanoate/2-iminopropanoate deaminase
MQPVSIPQAPAPAGHYSPALAHGGLLWLSGQLPIVATTGAQVHGDIEAQLACIFQNLDALLLAGGTDKTRVLKTTVYITDVGLWPRVNAAYAAYFGGHKPARSIVPVGPLHHGFLVELEAVAALD